MCTAPAGITINTANTVRLPQGAAFVRARAAHR